MVMGVIFDGTLEYYTSKYSATSGPAIFYLLCNSFKISIGPLLDLIVLLLCL